MINSITVRISLNWQRSAVFHTNNFITGLISLLLLFFLGPTLSSWVKLETASLGVELAEGVNLVQPVHLLEDDEGQDGVRAQPGIYSKGWMSRFD